MHDVPQFWEEGETSVAEFFWGEEGVIRKNIRKTDRDGYVFLETLIK